MISAWLLNRNHSLYLNHSLGNLVEQRDNLDEIVLLDDASTDDSVAFVKSNYPDVKVEVNPTRRGVIEGLNHAVLHAKGLFIYFAAADDWVFPGFFKQAEEASDKFPQAKVITGILEWNIDGDLSYSNVLPYNEPIYLPPTEVYRLIQNGYCRLSLPACVLNKRACNGFIPSLQWHCDWFEVYRMAMAYGILYVPTVAARYNVNSHGYSGNGRNSEEHKEVLDSLIYYLGAIAEGKMIMDSGALREFGVSVLKPLITHGQLSFHRAKGPIWYSFKQAIKPFLPKAAKEIYYKGYVAKHANITHR